MNNFLRPRCCLKVQPNAHNCANGSASSEHLVGAFSVADAYLVAVLNWSPYAGVDLMPWPAVQQYHQRVTRRPHVARAIREEFALYQQEQARHAQPTATATAVAA